MPITLSIELSDDDVAALRRWVKANPPDGRNQQVYTSNVMTHRLAAALPPEPVRLTIELPADLAARLAVKNAQWSPGQEVGHNGAAALNAVALAAFEYIAQQVTP